MKRKTPIPRISKKKLKALGRCPWSTMTAPKKKPRLRNSARRKREFARAFGSEERVAFVRALPCVGCYKGPCENHHIQTGGAGRKSDARFIVPLCHDCHQTIHQHGRYYYEIKHGVELEVQAELTEQAWHAHASRS